MDAIAALSNALKQFAGAVLVISHDQYFIKAVCTELWVIKDHSIKIFSGTFDDYKQMQLKTL